MRNHNVPVLHLLQSYQDLLTKNYWPIRTVCWELIFWQRYQNVITCVLFSFPKGLCWSSAISFTTTRRSPAPTHRGGLTSLRLARRWKILATEAHSKLSSVLRIPDWSAHKIKADVCFSIFRLLHLLKSVSSLYRCPLQLWISPLKMVDISIFYFSRDTRSSLSVASNELEDICEGEDGNLLSPDSHRRKLRRSSLYLCTQRRTRKALLANSFSVSFSQHSFAVTVTQSCIYVLFRPVFQNLIII